MIREVGADLMADFRYRLEMLGPVEVWGLDRFDPNWMVVKGQIKTRPLQQWSVARAFNLRIKRKMDEIGMDVPVPQMQVQMSREKTAFVAPHSEEHEFDVLEELESARAAAAVEPVEAPPQPEPLSPAVKSAVSKARDVSHEPRPAPPPTDQSVQIPPQIPTATEPGKG
jgi:small conductance mechanosensitive channel